MSDGKKINRFPGADWLGRRLTRKVILVFAAAAVLTLGLMCWSFLSYLDAFAGSTYDAALAESDKTLRQTEAFLLDAGPDWPALRDHLAQRGEGCTIQNEEGETVFEYIPEDWTDARLTVSGVGSAVMADGRTVELRIWARTMGLDELSASLQKNALFALSVLATCVFVVVAAMIYVLVVAPIVQLRGTMKE